MSASSAVLGFRLLVVLAVLLSAQLEAQVRSFKHFGLDKSVFPSRIECIDQATDGTLLIGTLAGLVMYDGVEFRNFGVSNGLSESSVSSLAHVDDKVIVGHWAGNVSVISTQNEKTSHWKTDEIVGFSSLVQVYPFAEDSIWALTRDGRLYELTPNQGAQLALPILTPDDKILQFKVLADRVFVLTQNHLIVGSNMAGAKTWEVVFGVDPAVEEMRCLWIDPSGLVRLGTTKGVYSIDAAFQRTGFIALEHGAAKICRDVNGLFWVATAENGVYQIDPSNGTWVTIKRENGLSYNQVRDLFIDRENNMWVATAAGLDQYLGDAFTLFDHRAGLQGSMVWDVVADGNQVVALTNRGLSVFALRAESEQPSFQSFVPAPDAEPRKLIGDAFSGWWMLDAEGELWMLDGENKRFVKTSWLNEPIKCMELVNGAIWLGTDDGVFVVEGNQVIEHLTTKTGLAGNRITGIFYSKQLNEAWITALGAKTTLYADGKLRQFGPDEGLTTAVIQDADFDLQGRVWLASYDKGVFYMNDQGRFVSLAEERKLTSNTTFALEIDDRGTVWIGHNWGVDAFNPATDSYQWFGEDDGFMGLEVNAGAMHLGRNGVIWMGTLMGLLHFDPSEIVVNNRPPNITVKKAFLGEYDLLASSDLEFRNAGADFNVDFRSVSLSNVSRNRYYYRIKGIHENWRELTKPANIEYLSLPVGSYVFELSACNNSGICNEQPFTISFSIIPPFYKTWWFYTLLFFILVAAILMMDKYRVVQLIEQRNKIEEVLALRDQQLMDAQEENNRNTVYWRGQVDMLQSLDARLSQSKPALPFAQLALMELSNDPLNAVGTIGVMNESFRLHVIVDASVGGAAGYAIRLAMQRAIDVKFSDELPDQKRVLADWKRITEETAQTFARFKGINWLMLMKEGDGWWVTSKGMTIFELRAERLNELPSNDQQWVAMPIGCKLLITNSALFQLLNAAGTKSYGLSELQKFFENHIGEHSQIKMEALKADLAAWKGSMEQEDDIAVYLVSNEA